MFGAITGDFIGSRFEFQGIKHTDFPLFRPTARFTDDTVMTVATAWALLEDGDYAKSYRTFGRRYPGRGYGNHFQRWLRDDSLGPYNSWGNGAAMRVSPVGYAHETEEKVLAEAVRSAEVSHDHPEGIKGAQATALAVFLARAGEPKSVIKDRIEERFGYDLSRSLESIRPEYSFDESCQRTVPEAIVSFLESNDFETCVRNAVSLGGDADTLAAIAGSIAEPFYGSVPEEIRRRVENRLPDEFLRIIERFEDRFGIGEAARGPGKGGDSIGE